ncbi:MAG: radical SAM protein [Candidatus Methanomethylicus sp.]|nr:radical SAM protein [Candidatus Methanomethylicus sp.]
MRFALAYPSPYMVGMSNLAVRLLYELINNKSEALCERFFFTSYRQTPKSIESGLDLTSFDVIGFSLQHEMDYTRMLDMIASAGIPPRSGGNRPVVIAGGPAVSSNPVPLLPFVDFFVIGEVEPIIDAVIEELSHGSDNLSKRMSGIPGILQNGFSAERIFAHNLDCTYHAIRQIHPVDGQGFSSTFLLEVSRGCNRGCRFCMECYTYRPRRERSLEQIATILEEGLRFTQTRKVTCISSAFFDHSHIADILALMKEKRLGFSVPSIRVTEDNDELFQLLVAGGQKTLTVAPETPSERLREILGKRFSNDQLLSVISKSREAGMASVKLYFMLGIPGETNSDLEGLKALLGKAISIGYRPPNIHITINPMIPKGNTPFQWAPIIGESEFKSRLSYFRRICSELGIKRVESMDYHWGVIQAFLSTGGAEASDLLARLLSDIENGGSGDLGSWRRVLRSLDKSFQNLYVPPSIDSDLPWEIIKETVPKSLLIREFEKAIGENYGPNIRK